VEIVAGIGVMNQIGEFFAVTGAAAGVRVKDDVTLSRPDLRLQVETIAKVGEGTAVNLENKGILLGGIKIRRLDDPTLDFAFVERGFIPEFLDCAQFPGREEFAIERGEDVQFRLGERSDSDVSGIGGSVVLDSERAVLGDAEIAGEVEMAGENFGGAVEREVGELGVTLIGVGEENALAVGGPVGSGGVAIESRSYDVRIAAIAVGNLKVGGLVALVAVIEADVGDEFAVG